MQPAKKQLEILLMHYFRQCHKAFPNGKLVPSESPDFILNLKTRSRIGIELTRLYPKSAGLTGSDYSGHHLTQSKIVELSQILFENSSELKLFVKFLFSDNHHFKEAGSMIMAVKITHAIRNAIKLRNSGESFFLVIESNGLPAGLEKVLVVSHPVLEVSIWERSDNLGISEDIMADINTAIIKKDEKLRLYHRQSLNLYWLIITTDRLQGAKNYNIQGRLLNSEFKSRFQNVFLFDLIKSTIHQLV